MKPLALLISIFLLSSSLTYAQLRIQGTIVDEDNQSIAYVSIGVPGSTFGTVSTKTGWFELDVDESVMESELCFYRMSFATQCVPIRDHTNKLTIQMKREPLQMPEVTVTPRGSRLEWGRNRPRVVNPGGYMFGMTNKGSQIAQRIPILQSGWIEAISLNTIVETHDSVRVRVSFHDGMDRGIGTQIPDTERIMMILKGDNETILQLEESSFHRLEDVIIKLEFLETFPVTRGNFIIQETRRNQTTTWHRPHEFREWDELPTFNFAIGVGIWHD